MGVRFPSLVGSVATTNASQASGTNLNLPSGAAAGLLGVLLFFRAGGSQTITISGWTEVTNSAALANSNTQFRAFFRKLDGSEAATIAFTSSITGTQTTQSYALYLENADLNAANPVIAEATEGSATSTAPNPPNFAPGLGSKDFLWGAISVMGASASATGYPTNYSLYQGTAVRSGVAFRQLTASSEDPGTFTTPSNAWKAKTIAILGNPVSADSVTVTQQSVEAMITDGAQAVRTTKQSAEAMITDGDQKVRVTQQNIEVMLAMNYSARRSRNRVASF